MATRMTKTLTTWRAVSRSYEDEDRREKQLCPCAVEIPLFWQPALLFWHVACQNSVVSQQPVKEHQIHRAYFCKTALYMRKTVLCIRKHSPIYTQRRPIDPQSSSIYHSKSTLGCQYSGLSTAHRHGTSFDWLACSFYRKCSAVLRIYRPYIKLFFVDIRGILCAYIQTHFSYFVWIIEFL